MFERFMVPEEDNRERLYGKPARTCEHGVSPVNHCRDCTREYHRVYANTVRRKNCKCGRPMTAPPGKKNRRCAVCFKPARGRR